MIIYKVNIYGDVETARADVGAYGEPVYNTREYSTTPPPVESGKVAKLVNKKWELVPDMRGVYYRKDNGAPVTVGIPVEEDARHNGYDLAALTKAAPSVPFPVWEKGAWKTDSEKQAEAEKAEADAAVNKLIAEKQKEIAVRELVAEGKITEGLAPVEGGK
jgi:hypothetical protein